MGRVAPFGEGRGNRPTEDSDLIVTFPLSAQMDGWRLGGAEVDETGFFLMVRFERYKGDS